MFLAVPVDLGDALSTGARLGHESHVASQEKATDPEIAALSDEFPGWSTNSPPRKRLTIPRSGDLNMDLLIVLTYVALAWAALKSSAFR